MCAAAMYCDNSFQPRQSSGKDEPSLNTCPSPKLDAFELGPTCKQVIARRTKPGMFYDDPQTFSTSGRPENREWNGAKSS
jgi:hypothetical protein